MPLSPDNLLTILASSNNSLINKVFVAFWMQVLAYIFLGGFPTEEISSMSCLSSSRSGLNSNTDSTNISSCEQNSVLIMCLLLGCSQANEVYESLLTWNLLGFIW